MRRVTRLIMASLSFITAIFVFIHLLYALRRPGILKIVEKYSKATSWNVGQIALVALLILLFIFCVFAFVYSIVGARLKKSRSKNTDIGLIDIGVGAIENIALNSAKAAQAGIKTAKARVYAAQNDEIDIVLAVVLYSDVEIPLQMAKIQDRVKKDVEKYTGIGVQSVKVKVTRVELLGTVVER